MPLDRIEDWDKFLEPLKQRSDKPTKPFVKLDRNKASEAALNGKDLQHDTPCPAIQLSKRRKKFKE